MTLHSTYAYLIAWIKGYDVLTTQDVIAMFDRDTAIANIIGIILVQDSTISIGVKIFEKMTF